jgi:hypothetical protein
MDNPINDTVFDSRDLIAYMEELQQELEEELEDTLETQEEIEPSQQEHFEKVQAFAKELEGYSDFHHGEAIICEEYFTTYTKELVSACGYLPQELPWWIVVDWDRTAEHVKMDYISVSYEGKDYFMRA